MGETTDATARRIEEIGRYLNHEQEELKEYTNNLKPNVAIPVRVNI